MRLVLYFVLLSQIMLVGCKEMESLENDIESLSELKVVLPINGPYTYEDNEELAKYFSGLNLLVKKIDEHPKGKKGLDRYLKDNRISRLCEKILISKDNWLQIMENCQVGDYFVCSEDVIEFTDTIELFSKNLSGRNRNKFVSNAECASDWQSETLNLTE